MVKTYPVLDYFCIDSCPLYPFLHRFNPWKQIQSRRRRTKEGHHQQHQHFHSAPHRFHHLGLPTNYYDLADHNHLLNSIIIFHPNLRHPRRLVFHHRIQTPQLPRRFLINKARLQHRQINLIVVRPGCRASLICWRMDDEFSTEPSKFRMTICSMPY